MLNILIERYYEMLNKFLRLILLLSIGLITLVVSSRPSSFVLADSAKSNALNVAVRSATQKDLITEYPISGSALNIVSSAPNNVWFTMPASNKIGNLTIDADGIVTINEYSALTANSEPYDLVYDGNLNVIWFTQKSANQLGRFDIATETMSEISTIPTANSMPTGISIAPDGSIWFAESGTNKLGQYVPSTNSINESAAYVPATAGVTNAEFTDVVISSSGDRIWVSAPADHKVLQYSTQTSTFSSLALSAPLDPILGTTRRPYNLTVAPNNIVWLTDIANNQIGQLFQGTLANVAWYTLPTSNSNPAGIAFGDTGGSGTIFFTGSTTDRVGSLTNSNDSTIVPSEYGLANGSQPAGITVDSSGNVWIAQGGSNTIALWSAPYYQTIYLPIIERN